MDGNYLSAYQCRMPFHKDIILIGRDGEKHESVITGHAWVAMDDENTMVYNIRYSFGEEPSKNIEERERGSGRRAEDQTADFRKKRNRE